MRNSNPGHARWRASERAGGRTGSPVRPAVSSPGPAHTAASILVIIPPASQSPPPCPPRRPPISFLSLFNFSASLPRRVSPRRAALSHARPGEGRAERAGGQASVAPPPEADATTLGAVLCREHEKAENVRLLPKQQQVDAHPPRSAINPSGSPERWRAAMARLGSPAPSPSPPRSPVAATKTNLIGQLPARRRRRQPVSHRRVGRARPGPRAHLARSGGARQSAPLGARFVSEGPLLLHQSRRQHHRQGQHHGVTARESRSRRGRRARSRAERNACADRPHMRRRLSARAADPTGAHAKLVVPERRRKLAHNNTAAASSAPAPRRAAPHDSLAREERRIGRRRAS